MMFKPKIRMWVNEIVWVKLYDNMELFGKLLEDDGENINIFVLSKRGYSLAVDYKPNLLYSIPKHKIENIFLDVGGERRK
jgi:hypothetical protein